MEKETTGKRTHCIRCGRCCLGSSPTLQKEDVPLVRDGHIAGKNLYTIRAGELVWDNIIGELKTIDQEVLKVREREGGCIYYDDKTKSCNIYEHRPAQCKALVCWDETEFMRVYEGPKAVRRDLVHDEVILRLIKEHEDRCSYLNLHKYARNIKEEGEEAVQNILELLRFDYQFRPYISKRLGINAGDMDLLFGRPLIQTIEMFGLKVTREPDGSFFLTVLK